MHGALGSATVWLVQRCQVGTRVPLLREPAVAHSTHSAAPCDAWHHGNFLADMVHDLLPQFRIVVMRQVIAIVKPYLAEKILDGLRLAPLEAIHVREVKGMSRQKSYLDQYTETEYSEAFLPKVEITAWVEDSRSEEVIRRLVELARTGRIGDGKIFVLGADTPESLLSI